MKIAFLGTPDFAVPCLQALIDAGQEIGVFTQPDRPQGRHAVLTPPPVKKLALEQGLPVYQFEKIRDAEGAAALRAFAPELMVTAAFGQILSAENLSVPKHGCINVHGSLLPKYRGAAPIQWAIIHGEPVTGITTMLTDVGLDTGDILLQRETPIALDETAGELYTRLAVLGAQVLLETIGELQQGALRPIPQQEALATKCAMLKKEHGKLCFTDWPAKQVHDRVRGVNPWPGAFAMLPDGNPLKIWRTRLRQDMDGLEPGVCVGDGKTGLFIGCADGKAVEVLELQAPGSKRMEAKNYLRGKPLDGVRLQ